MQQFPQPPFFPGGGPPQGRANGMVKGALMTPGGPQFGGGGDSGSAKPGFRRNMCTLFERTGKCSYGDTCKYSHGEDRGQSGGGDQHHMQQQQFGGGGSSGMGFMPGPPQGNPGSGGGGGEDWDRERERSNPGMRPQDKVGIAGQARKTRLCEKFMTTGSCPYENRCTFAHGNDELRGFGDNGPGMGGSRPEFRGPADRAPGQVMRHDGQQISAAGPPGAPQIGLRGPPLSVKGGPATPPGGPPPPAPPTAQHPGGSSTTSAPFSPSGVPPSTLNAKAGVSSAVVPASAAAVAAKEVTFVDRVRAICGILNIGNAAALSKEKPAALAAAVTAIRNGSAFRATPFADDADSYLA